MVEPARAGLRLGAGIAALLAAAVWLAACTAGAQAQPTIGAYSVTTSNTAAGGHPDITTQFNLSNPGAPDVAKDIEVMWPEGVFGNPQAIPRCSNANFALNECPSFSQVGWISVKGLYEGSEFHTFGAAPLYDMEPSGEDETARLAFTVPELNIPISIPVMVRTGSDYGLTLKVAGITQQIPFSEALIRVWGFPSSPENDELRFPIGAPGEPPGCPGDTTPGPQTCADLAAPTPSGILVRPFIDNPTVCTGPLPVTLRVSSYQSTEPAELMEEYPGTTECDSEVFRPVLDVGLTTEETDAPSGLNLRLTAKQVLGLTNSPSELRSAIVKLPQGFSVNPDAADGQLSCDDAQAGFGTEAKSQCPDSAKIGTMEVNTPALNAPLKGAVYIGKPLPGNQYRLFMLFDGFGIHAKLHAKVVPDPVTGRLTFEITDLPQVPFEEFDLHLFASDRGLIATPTRCAVYSTESEFIPWNDLDAPQTSRPTVSLRSGPDGAECPGQTRPFHPRLIAGTSNPIAGAFSAFTLKLDRDDGDQFLGDLNFNMPPGLTGSLRGIAYCPEQAITAAAANSGLAERTVPSCPAASEIGTTNVAAGPGSHPFHAVGKMYLAGPFKGAPLSVVAVTPALAGPYDYGVVVVRVAIDVNPQDAHVIAVSDTVPSIIGGIPIRMRSIQVNIDKPNFMINPTNCAPTTVDSQGIGDEGTVVGFSSPFQAANCGTLPFKPRMSVRQVGKSSTHRGANPSLQFDLRTREGDANVKSVAVTLSSAFEIDQRHLGNLCSEKVLLETKCAGRTPIGMATTTTPLLDHPLSGPVYAVSGSGGLPRLAFLLNGQVDLVPRADAKTLKGGRLQTTVPVVPDAPIGHFHLTVFGGKQGYLSNTRDICAHTPIVRVDFVGQNGRARSEAIKIKTACGGKSARHRRHHP